MQNDATPKRRSIFNFVMPVAVTGPAYELASRLQSERRERRHFFDADLLSDPVWEMLLALYLAAARRENLSVHALADAAGLPSSTTRRWLNVLVDRKLIVTAGETLGDDCFELVQLTNTGRENMKRYLDFLLKGQPEVPR